MDTRKMTPAAATSVNSWRIANGRRPYALTTCRNDGSPSTATADPKPMKVAKSPTKAKKTKTPKTSQNGSAKAVVDEIGKAKVEVVRALRRAKAVDSTSVLTLTKLSERLGKTRKEVYGLVSGLSGKAGSNPRCLMATGHVKVTRGSPGEESGELSVYLTKSGIDTDFSEAPFTK